MDDDGSNDASAQVAGDAGVTAPIVSVHIAVRDGAAYLAEAIESVLEQDYRPIETVVVDDGSRDDPAQVVRRFGSSIVFERQPPLGLSAARNRAVERSTGAFLAFLDADDLFEPGRLRRQVAALDAGPAIEAAFGRLSEFVDPSLRVAAVPGLRPPRQAVPCHLVSAMLIRRSAFERVGPFDTSRSLNVAVDWYSRALAAGLRSVMLDDVVLRRRLHGSNLGLTRWDGGEELLRIARSSLERRRSSERARRASENG